MSVLGRSASPQDSPVPESPTSSEASSVVGGSAYDGAVVLFESYLYKIPPLKKSILMVSLKCNGPFMMKLDTQTQLS
jgi:hypothetical protein